MGWPIKPMPEPNDKHLSEEEKEYNRQDTRRRLREMRGEKSVVETMREDQKKKEPDMLKGLMGGMMGGGGGKEKAPPPAQVGVTGQYKESAGAVANAAANDSLKDGPINLSQSSRQPVAGVNADGEEIPSAKEAPPPKEDETQGPKVVGKAEGADRLSADYGTAWENAQRKPTHPDGTEMSKDEYISMMKLKASKRDYDRRNPKKPPQQAAMDDSMDPGMRDDGGMGDSPTEVGQSFNKAGSDMIRGLRRG